MIKRISDFESLVNMQDWAGILAKMTPGASPELVEQLLKDSRAEHLTGVKLVGRWSGVVFGALRENAGRLTGLQHLEAEVRPQRGEAVPWVYFLNTFPGIRCLRLFGLGEIVPARHLCLEELELRTYLPTPALASGVQVDLGKLRILSECVFPALETLTLGFVGFGPSAGDQIRNYLPAILSGEVFPRLSVLSLRRVIDEDLAEVFVETILACDQVAPDLWSLDLSQGMFQEPRFLNRLEQWKPFQQRKVKYRFGAP